VINLVFGLAVGGVMGHWLTALPIFIIAVIGAIPGLVTAARPQAISPSRSAS